MSVAAVTVALARGGDESELLALQLQVDTETDMLYVEPGERSADPATLAERLAGADGGAGTFTLLALALGSGVGYATVAVLPFARMAATGELSLAVLRAAQGQGIGRQLLERTVVVSRARGLHRRELAVRCDNDRAQRLYAACGFLTEGVRREAVRVAGRWLDELHMALLL